MHLRPTLRTLSVILCAGPLGGCQIISGLAALTTEGGAPIASASTSASSSSGGGGSGGTNGSGGAGGGGGEGVGGSGGTNGGGGAGGGAFVLCEDYLAQDLTTRVDKLAITPDKSRLLWTSSPNGDNIDKSIMSWKQGEAAPTVLLPGANVIAVTQLAASDTFYFWLTGQEKNANGMFKWYLKGAAFTMPTSVAILATESSPTMALASTNSAAYWTIPAEGSLRAISMAGPTAYFSGNVDLLGAPEFLTPSEGSVYWRRKGSASFTEAIVDVSEAPPAAPGGGVVPEKLVDTDGAVDISIANGAAFWTENAPPSGRIRSGSISMGMVQNPSDVVSSIPHPTHIIAGSTYVYWAEGAFDSCSDVVKRIDIDGGTVTTLSSGGPCVSNFVQDQTYVYWGSGTTLCRAPR